MLTTNVGRNLSSGSRISVQKYLLILDSFDLRQAQKGRRGPINKKKEGEGESTVNLKTSEGFNRGPLLCGWELLFST